jgi:hypothetical protein
MMLLLAVEICLGLGNVDVAQGAGKLAVVPEQSLIKISQGWVDLPEAPRCRPF